MVLIRTVTRLNYLIEKYLHCLSYKFSLSVCMCVSLCVCIYGARCSSVVERPLMVRMVVGSITNGEPIEQFLVPDSAPRLV